jgi:hypothetical protein
LHFLCKKFNHAYRIDRFFFCVCKCVCAFGRNSLNTLTFLFQQRFKKYLECRKVSLGGWLLSARKFVECKIENLLFFLIQIKMNKSTVRVWRVSPIIIVCMQGMLSNEQQQQQRELKTKWSSSACLMYALCTWFYAYEIIILTIFMYH